MRCARKNLASARPLVGDAVTGARPTVGGAESGAEGHLRRWDPNRDVREIPSGQVFGRRKQQVQWLKGRENALKRVSKGLGHQVIVVMREASRKLCQRR